MTARLGAIELIELGDKVPRTAKLYSADPTRRPFLSGRRSADLAAARLGFLADIGSFLTGAFEFLFKTLADVVSVPLDLASQGIGVLFDGVAGLIANVPILGEFAAQLLIVSKTVIQWGLSVPGLLLEGVGNVFGEIKDAIDATRTPDEKAADLSAAKEKILDKAKAKGGEPLKNAVKDAIEGKPVTDPETGDPVDPPNPAPPGGETVGVEATDLEKAVKWGIPAAGAAAVLFMVLS